MPMIMISGLGSILPGELALAILILPTLASNLFQAVRDGVREAGASARRFWRYLVDGGRLDPRLGAARHGACRSGSCSRSSAPSSRSSLRCSYWAGALRWRRGTGRAWNGAWARWRAGSGAFRASGGRHGDVPVGDRRARSARACAFRGWSTASARLRCAGAPGSGVLNGETLPLSAAMLVPAGVGMALGLAVQDRLDQVRFRKATLVVLTICRAEPRPPRDFLMRPA